MTIRCKFKCNEIITRIGHFSSPKPEGGYETKTGPVFSAVMTPVYSEDPNSENKQFWDATPSGKFEVGTVKQMPWKLGSDYYIDITPVDTGS